MDSPLITCRKDGEEADLLAANETEHYKDGGDGDEYNEDDDASPSEEPMDSDAIDNGDFGKKKSPKKTHVLQSLTNESGRKPEPNHLTKPRTGLRRNGRTAQTRKVRMRGRGKVWKLSGRSYRHLQLVEVSNIYDCDLG